MPIYDNNGTTNAEIGKVYDNNGTTNYQIGKVYDNNGTTNSLIYTSSPVYLYNVNDTNNDECVEETGGWEFNNGSTFNGASYNGLARKTELGLQIADHGSVSYIATVTTKKPIDLTHYTKLTVKGTVHRNGCIVTTHKEKVRHFQQTDVIFQWENTGNTTFDISSLSGAYYITAFAWNGSNYSISEVYLSE